MKGNPLCHTFSLFKEKVLKLIVLTSFIFLSGMMARKNIQNFKIMGVTWEGFALWFLNLFKIREIKLNKPHCYTVLCNIPFPALPLLGIEPHGLMHARQEYLPESYILGLELGWTAEAMCNVT